MSTAFIFWKALFYRYIVPAEHNRMSKLIVPSETKYR